MTLNRIDENMLQQNVRDKLGKIEPLEQQLADIVNLKSFKLPSDTSYDNAFSKAIQYMKDNQKYNLFIPDDEDIILTNNPVILDIPYMGVFGSTNKEQGAKILASNPSTSVFEVQAQGVSFENLLIQGNAAGQDDHTSSSMTIDGIKYNLTIPDCDSRITNVSFIRLNKCVWVIGRNVRAYRCLFAIANRGMYIQKHANSGANGNDIRAINIIGCNFHTMQMDTGTSVCVEVADFTPLQSINIQDNYFDQYVDKLYKGYINGTTITGNFGNSMNQGSYFIEAYASISGTGSNEYREFTISNNDFTFNKSGRYTHFLFCSGTLIGGKIMGNTIVNTNSNMIKVGGLSLCDISNNKFVNPGYGSTSSACIVVDSSAAKTIIKNNAIIADDIQTLSWAINITSSDVHTRVYNNFVVNATLGECSINQTTPTLTNSWVEKDSANAPLKISQKGKVIYLSGWITGGTITFNTLMGTIPVKYAPKKQIYSVVTVYNGTAYVTGNITIKPNGEIYTANIPSNTNVILDNCSWVIE